MGHVTHHTYICDGCGKTSNNINFDTRSGGGHGILSLQGHGYSRAWDGSAGGANYEDEWLLCDDCVHEVRKTIESLKEN